MIIDGEVYDWLGPIELCDLMMAGVGCYKYTAPFKVNDKVLEMEMYGPSNREN